MENRKETRLSSQISILIWKNFKVKLRQSPAELAVELLSPLIAFCISLVFLMSPAAKYYKAVEESPLTGVFNGSSLSSKKIHVVPDTYFTRSFTSSLNDRFKAKYSGGDLQFSFYDNDSTLIAAVEKNPLGVGLGLRLPKESSSKLKISILTNPIADDAPSVKEKTVSDKDKCRDAGDLRSCPMNKYFYSSFLSLQTLVSESVIKGTSNNSVEIELQMQNYPQNETCDGAAFVGWIPLIPVFCFTPMSIIILVGMADEAFSGRKDALRIIGISDFAYWSSWLITYTVPVLFLSLIMSAVMQFLPMTKHINMLPMLLTLFFLGESNITLSFLVSTVFDWPQMASSIGGTIVFSLSLLFLLPKIASPSHYPLMLLSPVAGSSGIYELLRQVCSKNIGLSEFRPSGAAEKAFYYLLFLILDTVVYFWLAVYLMNIFPNIYGYRKSCCYCFSNGSSLRNQSNTTAANANGRNDPQIVTTADGNAVPIEKVPSTLQVRPSIQVRSVKKEYLVWICPCKKLAALDGVSLTAYEGHITGILGTNGAGKSTLLNILAGILPPDEGDVRILGLDMQEEANMSRVHKIMGMCLQSEVFYDGLTVEEQLVMFATLRGVPRDQMKYEVESLLEDLDLTEKRRCVSKNLSGGQQRKLSLGIALIGDPKIILLDEPTAGLDPVSRRKVWIMLKKRKVGKIILLTTHFMDEADVVADQKAIICHGKLQCMGSSLFLKNIFGTGYRLTLELADPDNEHTAADQIIKKHIPSALESRKVTFKDVTYILPLIDAKKFPAIISEIEQLVEAKGPYVNFGIAMPSLEDVFLKVSADAEVKKEEEVKSDESENFRQSESIPEPVCEPTERDAFRIWTTMSLIRLKAGLRQPDYWISIILVPLVLIGIWLDQMRASTKFLDLDLTALKDDYCGTKPRLAISESNGSSLLQFLHERGIRAIAYTGDMDDLERLGGTDAAVNVMVQNLVKPNMKIKAVMRVNETFAHQPGHILYLLTSFVASKSGSQNLEVRLENYPVNTIQSFRYGEVLALFVGAMLFIFLYNATVLEFVRERESRIREQLRITGLPVTLYICTFCLRCSIMALVLMGVTNILIFSLGVAAYTAYGAAVWITILLLLHFPAGIIGSAALSYVFDTTKSAQTFVFVLLFVSNFVCIILVLYIPIIHPSLKNLHILIAFLNVYFVPSAIFWKVYQAYVKHFLAGTAEAISFQSYSVVEIWSLAIVSLIQIPLLYGIVFLVDTAKSSGECRRILSKVSPSQHTREDVSDKEMLSKPVQVAQDDVENEFQRVKKFMHGETDELDVTAAAENVHKSYKHGSARTPVLRGISLMVKKGEIFALLGHNGSGKTTLMKILVGQKAVDSGKVKLLGQDIRPTGCLKLNQIGFCPQQDALWPDMTVREHFMIYGLVQGVPYQHVNRAVEAFLKILHLEEDADKTSEDLSEGTKRKLSYGLCMISCPRFALLDEPSTGVDAVSKRFLWNVILSSFKEKRGAILTTHAMEEADVLSTRIGILVNGRLACVGSPQHLKSKYGNSYTLELKLKPGKPSQESSDHESEDQSTESVHSTSTLKSIKAGNQKGSLPPQFRFLMKRFPKATLVEEFADKGVFSIPKSDVDSVSSVFKYLESIKGKRILEYGFSQTTLEQVFLDFQRQKS